MTTRTEKLLAFMNDAPDGKYEVVKPTDDQLGTVLPWLIDQTVKWAHKNGHCDTVGAGIANLLGIRWDGAPFYDADGYNCYNRDRDDRDRNGFDRNGFNAEGRDRNGYDRNGFNAEGYNYRGFNKDGFNAEGVDRHGNTREQHIAKLVAGWSKPHLEMVAAKLTERTAAAAEAAVAEAQAEVPAEESVPVAV